MCFQTLVIQCQCFGHCFIHDLILCGTSCCLSTHIIQNECPAYITIQTLLLWKALSFLLCAGKQHWEHEQNTSKQDTNSCCWLNGWMPLSICLWFWGKETRQNSTNYGIITLTTWTKVSGVGRVLRVTTPFLFFWGFFFYSQSTSHTTV